MNLQEFIQPEFFILVAVLWVVGLFLKLHPRFKAEWSIPFILSMIGVVAAVIYNGFVVEKAFTAEGVVVSILQGILVAGMAVFINEGGKQLIKKKPVDESDQ